MCKKVKLICFLAVAVFLLSGCQKHGGTVEKNYSLLGVVVDGYIKDATVCIDFNLNGVCDSGEPRAQTNKDGEFLIKFNKNRSNSIVLLAYGGVDTVIEKDYNWQLGRVFFDDDLNSNQPHYITPLTTMVQQSFINLCEDKTRTCYDLQSERVYTKLDLNATQLYANPMQNPDSFVKTQYIEALKNIVFALFESEFGQRDDFDAQSLRQYIEEALEISSRSTLNVDTIINMVTMKCKANIPVFKREYTTKLLEAIHTKLQQSVSSSLAPSQLEFMQQQLDASINQQLAIVTQANDADELSEPVISLTLQAAFDSNDAVEDNNACIGSEIYNFLSSSSFSPFVSIDEQNGIQLRSDYGVSGDYNPEVVIYYPTLEIEKKDSIEIVFEGDYYFAFDRAWVDSLDNIVYVKLPMQSGGLQECYRYKLNTTNSSAIEKQKVFRYEL